MILSCVQPVYMSSVNLVKKFAAMLVVGFPNCAPPSVQSAKRWNALGVLKDRCQNVLGVVLKTLVLIVVLIRSAAHAMKYTFVTVKAAKKEGIYLSVQHAKKLFVQHAKKIVRGFQGGHVQHLHVFVVTALLMRCVLTADTQTIQMLFGDSILLMLHVSSTTKSTI